MFRILIFDLDDTLLDTSRLLIPQAEKESCLAMIGAGLDSDLEQCLRVRKKLISQNVRAQIFEASVNEIGVKPGVNASLVAAAGSRAFYEREVESDIYLDPEVVEMLEKLKDKYELILVTAGSVKTQMQKVKILNIEKFFKEMIFVDLAAGQTKAQAFKLLAEKTQIPTEKILSIGDRIDTDVAGAKSIGMKACWVVKGEFAKLKPLSQHEEPDFKVSRITEIENVCRL